MGGEEGEVGPTRSRKTVRKLESHTHMGSYSGIFKKTK